MLLSSKTSNLGGRLLEGKTEVIKHSAAIHIANKVSLLQRRAWNLLLAHAYDRLPSQDVYSISVNVLSDRLGYDSKDEKHLKAALRALATYAVEWDVLDKDGSPDWGVTTLLAQARIRGGICTYAYSPELRERLHNPKVYARISLSLQNEFTSKHALALYELFVDYLDEARNYGETPYIPLMQFRKLMGIAEGSYTAFKKLNTRVIKEPIEEINTRTDLNVTVAYQRHRRRVCALKFKIQRVLEAPIEAGVQGDLFQPRDDMPPVVSALREAGLASADAWAIWQQGTDCIEAADKPEAEAFDAYIREKIDLLKRRQAQGKVASATGFLLSAIKHNYPNPEFAKAAMKRRRAHQERAEAERQAALRERFEAHREQVFWQRFGERPEAWQAEQRQRFEAMIQQEPLHRFVWQSYREHQSLQAPSVAGVFMEMLAGELLTQPEETSLAAFAAWAAEV
jgi:hypothetical protein